MAICGLLNLRPNYLHLVRTAIPLPSFLCQIPRWAGPGPELSTVRAELNLTPNFWGKGFHLRFKILQLGLCLGLLGGEFFRVQLAGVFL